MVNRPQFSGPAPLDFILNGLLIMFPARFGDSKSMNDAVNKAIPVGVTDYIELSSSPFYVDTTLFLKTVVDMKSVVTVFTRPDGFGKSTLMSMVKTFYEKTDQDTSVYFKDKKIWQCGEKYTSTQGKYPVLYLDIRDIRGTSWNETLGMFKGLFKQEYRRHMGLRELRFKNELRQQYCTTFSGVLKSMLIMLASHAAI